ncbi:chlorohydrolase [Streptococcus pneumoniae]|nr:chlorohydrolase [Streptococcus pneumoniae]
MKIKDQTRKLATGCSKHCFEVADRTDEVSNIYRQGEADGGLKRFSKSIRKNQSPKGADYEVIVYRHF